MDFQRKAADQNAIDITGNGHGHRLRTVRREPCPKRREPAAIGMGNGDWVARSSGIARLLDPILFSDEGKIAARVRSISRERTRARRIVNARLDKIEPVIGRNDRRLTTIAKRYVIEIQGLRRI